MQFRKEKQLKFRFSLCLPAVGVGSVNEEKRAMLRRRENHGRHKTLISPPTFTNFKFKTYGDEI